MLSEGVARVEETQAALGAGGGGGALGGGLGDDNAEPSGVHCAR